MLLVKWLRHLVRAGGQPRQVEREIAQLLPSRGFARI
jgi:hypothetical protein